MKRTRTNHIIVHCSATPPDMDIGFKEIDQWHRAKGWKMCGYHIIIRRDGTVELGRGIDEVGAHVEGYNHDSIGICLIGGVNKKNQPEDNFKIIQKDKLWDAIEKLVVMFPKTDVGGHRDYNAGKACPSFDVKAEYADHLHSGE